MYAQRLRNGSGGMTWDFCVLDGDGSGFETHIRVTNIVISGTGDSTGQVLLGHTTTETKVSECDRRSCNSLLVQERVMILSIELAESVRILIQNWRRMQGQSLRRAVLDGPSREELFDSLRLSKEDRTVKFLLHLKEEDFANFSHTDDDLRVQVTVHVRGIESARKTECDWNIVLHVSDGVLSKPYLVGTYNSTSRRGWLTQVDKLQEE